MYSIHLHECSWVFIDYKCGIHYFHAYLYIVHAVYNISEHKSTNAYKKMCGYLVIIVKS